MTTAAPPGLLTALQSGDPLVAIQAAAAAALPTVTPSPTASLSVYDQFYTCIDADARPRSLDIKLQDPRLALPAGSWTLDGGDWLADTVIDCKTVPVPVIYNKGPYRWSGRVDVAHDKSQQGVQTLQCELIGDRTWLDRICAWPNPFAPVSVQEPGEWYAAGPGLTVISTLIMEQAFRLQAHLWELVNDITSLDLNFQGWLNNLLYGDDRLSPADLLQALRTPICVVPINPLKDESAWIEINGRMDTVWKLVQQQLQDNGWDIDATMWIPGDPQPEGLAWPLTVATCVITLTDRSGFTGPWGPFEGLAIDLVDLTDSLVGQALSPLLNSQTENAYLTPDLDEFVAPGVGVNFTPPTVYFNLDVVESGYIDFDIAHHAPLAYQVVVGGQSPEWINDLINSTLEWAIDSITIALGVTGVPNSMLDGLFDNVLFAFSVAENYNARLAGGPYLWPEKFFPSGEGGLSLDTIFAEESGLWNVRGYPSGQISFLDSAPFAVGREIFRGMLVFYIRRGTLYIDYVENIGIADSRENYKVTLQIGDGKSEESQAMKVQRKLVGIETYMNILLSGGNLSQ